MSYTSTSLAPAFGGLFSGFEALRLRMADKTRRAHAYRQTYRQLEAMTDRELADIGISRLQIAEIAEEAAACA